MNVNQPPPRYDQRDEASFRASVEEADRDNVKRGADFVIPYAQRLVLTSPNGSLFAVTVSNAGALSAVAYP